MGGLTRMFSGRWVSWMPWVLLGIEAALGLVAVVLGGWAGLVSVVRKTMQPAHASPWLRSPGLRSTKAEG